jgi:hypothetical protein
MEFNYVAFNSLVKGEGIYDWTLLDSLLSDVSSRGNQAVFRVYLEYPGRESTVPEYLTKAGLRTFTYDYRDTNESPKPKVTTPDYRDTRLQKAILDFIRAMGKRYDGDPRIGFITAGLLGYWGEWHNYPRNDLWATKSLQSAVMSAYEESFRETKILLRYPAGPENPDKAPTVGRRFGYHDDSFAWGTLDTGSSWFFMAAMKAAGPTAIETWKTQPIGGEVRPELWRIIHQAEVPHPQAQDFFKCVEETHVSWLMDSGAFSPELTPRQRLRAIQGAQRMGYDYWVSSARLTPSANSTEVEFTVENRGVAPFYYDWTLELSARRPGVTPIRTPLGSIRGILPGEKRSFRSTLGGLGYEELKIQVRNPLPGGKPFRFANAQRLQNKEGALFLMKPD